LIVYVCGRKSFLVQAGKRHLRLVAAYSDRTALLDVLLGGFQRRKNDDYRDDARAETVAEKPFFRQAKVRRVSITVKAEGPSGRAKIRSDDPKHALSLVQYLRAIGYKAWIEDTNGNEIDEKALKMAMRSSQADALS
jgi:hypothetical protein